MEPKKETVSVYVYLRPIHCQKIGYLMASTLSAK